VDRSRDADLGGLAPQRILGGQSEPGLGLEGPEPFGPPPVRFSRLSPRGFLGVPRSGATVRGCGRLTCSGTWCWRWPRSSSRPASYAAFGSWENPGRLSVAPDGQALPVGLRAGTEAAAATGGLGSEGTGSTRHPCPVRRVLAPDDLRRAIDAINYGRGSAHQHESAQAPAAGVVTVTVSPVWPYLA
jgi:hypothetical protein